MTRATHLRGRAAAAHGVRWSLPRGCLLGIHSPRLPRPGRRRGAGRTEGGTEEAAGTAGPGQTSAAAPQTPPRRPLILLLPADVRGRAGPGGGGAWWGRDQSTAARGVPARPAAPPPRRGRFRRGDGGGGAAPQELAELRASSFAHHSPRGKLRAAVGTAACGRKALISGAARESESPPAERKKRPDRMAW